MTENGKQLSGDFSLILGGPLYQILRRSHLTGDVLELMRRRVIFISLFAWAPLLVLSILEGNAWGQGVKVPFLHDVDVHVRFLLALPLFIVAELVVHQRMRNMVRQFEDRGLIPEAAQGRFDAAIASAMRLRNSIMAEVLLIALVYFVGVAVVWRTQAAMDGTTWYGSKAAGKLQPSLAGWWFGLLSLPLMQFILLRWYFRIFIWARFLWQVSRIELCLEPTHPDRVGGLGFLSGISFAFAPLLAGQGALLAGLMANKIFFAGAKLPDFKLELVAIVGVMLFVVLGPVLVFAPRLSRAKRKGMMEFGLLAQDYAREFNRKWLSRERTGPPNEPLLGSADIQSMADLGNSFEVVKGMRMAPFTKETVIRLAAVTLLPVAPLVLTMIPLSELLDRFLKVVF